MDILFNKLIIDLYYNYSEYVMIILIIFMVYKIYIEGCPKLNYNNIKKSYNNIKKDLDTGDLVLFCSSDYIGKVIRKFSNYYFSHCGIIIRHNNQLYVLECDMDSNYDFITQKEDKYGVHLVSLDDKLKDYTGNIFGYCKLEKNNINELKLNNIINECQNIEFNNNVFAWYSSRLKNNNISNFLKNKNRMFCSEFVAYVYQKLGILKQNNLPNMYTIEDLQSNKYNNIMFSKLILFKT